MVQCLFENLGPDVRHCNVCSILQNKWNISLETICIYKLNQLSIWGLFLFGRIEQLIINPDDDIFGEACSDFSDPNVANSANWILFDFAYQKFSPRRKQNFIFNSMTIWEISDTSSSLRIDVKNNIIGFLPISNIIDSFIWGWKFSPLENFSRLEIIDEFFAVIVRSCANTTMWR